MEAFIKKNRFAIILAVLIVIYIAFFSYFSILRHQTLNSEHYDLAIMDQTVYNTSRGRILELTDPTGAQTIKRMAIHNDILLAGLAPFYWIYPHPETLLIVQTIVLALGAFFVYKLARFKLKSPWLALTLSFAYLMYPPLQWSNLFDFHAVTLATTFLLGMVYFAFSKRYVMSFIFFILALLSKEQVSLVCAFFGVYLFFDSKHTEAKRFAITLAFVGVLWFILSFLVIIPSFRQGSHFALSRYEEFLTRPADVAGSVIDTSGLTYLNRLISPLLYMPVLSPISLVVLPEFAINLLSSDFNQRDIIHHYTAVITPFLFMGAIWGLARFDRRHHVLIGASIVISTLYWSYQTSPLPYSKKANLRPFSPNLVHIQKVSQWQNILRDENIKVAATGTLAPHFSDRKVIMRLSESYKDADYVIVLEQAAYNDWYNFKGTLSAYSQLLVDESFRLVDETDGFKVFQKIKTP